MLSLNLSDAVLSTDFPLHFLFCFIKLEKQVGDVCLLGF